MIWVKQIFLHPSSSQRDILCTCKEGHLFKLYIIHDWATVMYTGLFCSCLFTTLFVHFSQDYMMLPLYIVCCTTKNQESNYSSIHLKFERFFPSKIDNKKAFLSSSFAMLCAPNKASLVTPSALSRGSSAGLLRERSISMWLSLIHWARKNCLANYK